MSAAIHQFSKAIICYPTDFQNQCETLSRLWDEVLQTRRLHESAKEKFERALERTKGLGATEQADGILESKLRDERY